MAKAQAFKVATTTKKEKDETEVIQPSEETSQVGTPADLNEDAPVNTVGQKIDEPITESNEAYVTPDGKIMVVQMKEEGQVFAGENGRNAQWYPKDILKSWTKKTS